MNEGRDFWSRRRAGVAAEAEAQEVHAALREDEALAERPDEEILAELDLPEPEALETPEAVRDFLNNTLPQRLKTRALRRLWRLNPVLANLDGLVDYGEDYTDAATVIENMQTVYQVGKGMLTAWTEDDDEDEGGDDAETPDLALADADADTETDTDTGNDMGDERAPEIGRLDTPATPDTAYTTDEPMPVAMPQRRMRFDFAQT